MSFAFSVTARKTLLRMQRRFYNFQMCSTCFWMEHSANKGKSQIVVSWSIFLDYWHPFKGTSSRTSFRFYQGLWGLFLLRWRTVDVLCFRPWRPSWRSDTTLLLPANAVCIENLKCSAKKNRIRKVTGLTALDSWPSKCYLRSSPIDIQSYFLSWFQSAKTCLVGRIDIASESCMMQ